LTKRRRIAGLPGLERNVLAASAAAFLLFLGEELWKKFLPRYLEACIYRQRIFPRLRHTARFTLLVFPGITLDFAGIEYILREGLEHGLTAQRKTQRLDTPDQPPLPVAHGYKPLCQGFLIPVEVRPVRQLMNVCQQSPHLLRRLCRLFAAQTNGCAADGTTSIIRLGLHFQVTVRLAELFLQSVDLADVVNGLSLTDINAVFAAMQANELGCRLFEFICPQENVEFSHQEKTVAGDKDLTTAPAEMQNRARHLLDGRRWIVEFRH
jgi:hypothetical protein